MSENKSKDLFYINIDKVQGILRATNKTAMQVSFDLGWSKSALTAYLNMQNLISRENVTQLAKYFHEPNTYFINYSPRKAQIKKYEENKKRRRELRTDSVLDTQADKIQTDDHIKVLHDEMQILITAVNNLTSSIEDIKDQNDKLQRSINGLSKAYGDNYQQTRATLKDIQNRLAGSDLDKHFLHK